ncbi:facilitated trehalose transporter Tret1-like [Diprion similis]|uniref:facilitated trehalose transporter Tret1-like n=1 Tax=Diprion similis TaxID=362088 RepID=UPI001EF86F2A|nr:facilitated trehalose transporter Tret1-like [Diprion similis]
MFAIDVLWLQWIGGFAAMIMMFVNGLWNGWTSPYLAQFESGNSPFPVTTNEISWIASINTLGQVPGGILGAIFIEYFGNRRSIVGIGFSLLLSWILVIMANSASWIYVAKFISGAASQFSAMGISLFLGDICSPNIRGAMVTMAFNGVLLGVLVGNVIGPYISMRIFACIAIVLNIFPIGVFMWLPESPYYLVSKDKLDDAKRSILRYNPKADVDLEVESIKNFVTTKKSVAFVDRVREFNISRNRKNGLILIGLIIFSECSGLAPLSAYMEIIMIRGSVTVISPATVPVIANSVGLIAAWTAMYFVEKCGRRIMWAVSSGGICVSMIALGTHFYLLGSGYDPTILQWLPILAVVLFKSWYNLGVSCIPSIALSEIFASNIRTLAACLSSVSSGIFSFIVIYVYQWLLELMDEGYVYWIHAVFMAISLMFGWLLVQETKGKTLMEIQSDAMKDERMGH